MSSSAVPLKLPVSKVRGNVECKLLHCSCSLWDNPCVLFCNKPCIYWTVQWTHKLCIKWNISILALFCKLAFCKEYRAFSVECVSSEATWTQFFYTGEVRWKSWSMWLCRKPNKTVLITLGHAQMPKCPFGNTPL